VDAIRTTSNAFTGGGEEIKVLDSLNTFFDRAAVDAGLISFRPRRIPSSFSIFATRTISPVATFQKPLGVGLSVSPDGRWLLYTQSGREGSELMLVENFH